MDYEKKIRILISENEFLQLQLEDLNSEIKKRYEEINLLGDVTESTAALRSKIDSNFLEIEQLKYSSQQASEKFLEIEMMNEELGMNLYKEIKERQRGEEALKEMNSLKSNMEIISEELNETAVLYKTVQTLKAELAEVMSTLNLLEIDNKDLKIEIEELKELNLIYKLRKLD